MLDTFGDGTNTKIAGLVMKSSTARRRMFGGGPNTRGAMRAVLLLACWLLVAATVVVAPTVAAQTSPADYVVDTTVDGPGNCAAPGSCSLRAAIDAANDNPGSTIEVPAGAYVLTDGELDITAAVTIVGASQADPAEATIIDAAGGSRVLDVRSSGVTITGVTVTGGDTNQTGGGIRVANGADLTLEDSVISSNEAREGGGIDVDGSATVLRSTFVDNTANRKGGGIRVDGVATIVNSTFTLNQAQSGGAVSVAGTADISFSTFVDNTSNTSSGGGVDRNGGTVTIEGSILTRSQQSGDPGSDCSGTPDLVGVNIVGDAQGCNPGAGTIVGQADLGPLALNGGPTPTIAILEGSIGVDAIATPCAVDEDQRGVTRPGGTACEVGAFEIAPLEVALTLDTVSPAGFADGVVPVGAQTVPAANIPAAVNETQALFDGTLQASPLNAFPLNATPLNAFPLNAFPLNAFPLNAFPLNAFFTQAAPLNAFPLNAFPLNAFPLDTILVSDLIILEDPATGLEPGWDQLLAGSPFEGAPLQAITLQQVLGDPVVQANLDTYEVGFEDLNLQGTPLNAFPLNAFLLPLPLNAFPLNAFAAAGDDADRVQAWCDLFGGFCTNAGVDVNVPATYQDLTLTTIALSGESLQSLDLTAAPLNAFFTQSAPLNAFPLNAFPLNAFNWVASPLNAFPLNAFPLNAFAGIIDCGALPGGTCDDASLGDVAAAGAFLPGATFQDLADLAAANPGLFDGFGVADVLIGLIPPESVPWEQIDLTVSGLQNAAEPLEPPFQYVVSLQQTAPSDATTVDIVLPAGFAYSPGSATFDGAPVGDPVLSLSDAATVCVAGSDTAQDDRVVMTFDLGAVATGGHELVVDIRAGLELGVETASACVTASDATGTVGDSDDSSVTVIEGVTAPGQTLGGAQLIQGDVVTLAHVATSDDVDLYSFQVSEAQANLGLQAEIFLSNLPADYDLTLYVPRTAPLRGDPVDVLSYLDDVTLDLNPFDDKVQADTVQDIPQALPASVPNAGQFVVKAISSNRNTTDELIETGTLRQGLYYVQVSSYQGALSTSPYALRLRTTESLSRGPCAALTYPGAPGSLPSPASLPAGVNTLFLVNSELLQATYPADAAGLLAKLDAVAGRADLGVIGAVIPVEGDAAVRAAYQARFAEPCQPLLSNDVVSAIGDVIDSYTDAHPTIEYIVLVGDDRQIPMANIVDDANFANERVFSQNFIGNNESIAALLAGMYRTDDPYGTSAGIRVRDHELFVPELAVGRLVETPAEIDFYLDNFLSFGGRLDPGTAETSLQTGYEFLTDGAEANVDALAAGGYTVDSSLINDVWTASNLEAALQTPRDVVGVHAHFDQANALPAFDNFNGVTDLFSTTDVPVGFGETIVYSMGCHSGYSVSDVQVAGSGTDGSDWAQRLTGEATNVYAGNTGFGYGDSDKVALAERLTAFFAEEVTEDGSIGHAWRDAKNRMLADILVLDAYQEKTLMQFVFYGLPMFHVGEAPPDLSGGAPAAAATAAPAVDPGDLETDPATGLTTTTISVTPSFVQNPTDSGIFWTDGADGPTLDINGRPIQPLSTADATAAGLVARDALITGLSSNDILGVDPVHFRSATDFGQPRPEYLDSSFPAELVGVSTSQQEGARVDQLLLAVGQFRADPTSPDTGTQRLHGTIDAQVYYLPEGADLSDTTPPEIRRSQGFIGNGLIFFDVVTDGITGNPTETRRVVVLYREEGTGGTWDSVDLFLGGDGRWRGGRPFTGTDAEFFVQAVDDAGNVAMSDSKSLFFLAADPPQAGDIAVTASPALPTSGWYTAPVTVTVSLDGQDAVGTGVQYSLDGGPPQAYTGSIGISEAGAHVVEAFLPGAGDFGVLYVALDPDAPVVSATVAPDAGTPVSGSTYGGDAVVTLSADDDVTPGAEGSGVASLTYAVDGGGATPYTEPFTVSAPGGDGSVSVDVVATDVAGNSTTEVVVIAFDVTGPVVVCDPAPAGWQNADVSLACSASDATVGLADPADAAFTLDFTIPDGTFDAAVPPSNPRDVADLLGNTTSTPPVTVQIDKASPTIDLIDLDGDGTDDTGTESLVVDLGEVLTVAFTCGDQGSGVASCTAALDDGTPVTSGGALPTDAVGAQTLTVTAVDDAGNTTTASASYVVAYGVCLDYDPTQAKQIGSNYTIRLFLCDGDGTNLSDRTIVLTAISVTRADDTTQILGPEDSGNANSGLEFRYRANSNSYIFNLDTTNIPYIEPGTYALNFTTEPVDPSDPDPATPTNSAPFTLRE